MPEWKKGDILCFVRDGSVWLLLTEPTRGEYTKTALAKCLDNGRRPNTYSAGEEHTIFGLDGCYNYELVSPFQSLIYEVLDGATKEG